MFGKKMIHHRKLLFTLAALSVAALVSCDRPSGVGPETNEQAGSTPDLEQFTKLHGDVTFTLEDGEALHREHPDTFWIPPKERRGKLVKDDLVKLVFNLTDGKRTQGERMWVIVKSGDGIRYRGTLDNNPYCTDKIKAGYEVSFEARNVIAIFEDESPNSQKAEHNGADQPATAPESKLRVNDKPNVPAKGRSK